MGGDAVCRYSINPTNRVDRRKVPFKKYVCLVCGWIYDEERGSPQDGIAPGTRWKDVPEDWVCPECGAPKSDFALVEVDD